jgi:hypothetical protein
VLAMHRNPPPSATSTLLTIGTAFSLTRSVSLRILPTRNLVAYLVLSSTRPLDGHEMCDRMCGAPSGQNRLEGLSVGG